MKPHETSSSIFTKPSLPSHGTPNFHKPMAVVASSGLDYKNGCVFSRPSSRYCASLPTLSPGPIILHRYYVGWRKPQLSSLCSWAAKTELCAPIGTEEESVSDYVNALSMHQAHNPLISCISDPLVHHGRHFGRTVHALCNVNALITNGILRLGELVDEPEESFTPE